MDQRELRRLDSELSEYLGHFVDGLGRTERREALRMYMTGLLLDGERKSMEPIALRLVSEASQAEAMRQRLQQAVAIADWGNEVMLSRLAKKLDRELPGVEAFVIDDTGFGKKGNLSVGVQRQYSGTLGRVDNCQVAVSLHLAGEHGGGMIGFRLFLPESWAGNATRRRGAGVPQDVMFASKAEIALAQLDWALACGVRRHVVLADGGYGESTDFRDELAARGFEYVVAVNGEIVVWPPQSTPRVARKPIGSRGRPPTRHRDQEHPPVALKALAPTLRFRKVSWRQGSRGRQTGEFSALRVRTAHRHQNGVPPGDEQWLLCQRIDGGKSHKYWLSNLPATTKPSELVRFAKLRWRIERDYQELKQEIGLDHYEGRTWRGFHHHATLCAVAHGFLALRRALFPPAPNAMDPAHGATTSAARPAPTTRKLSSMPAALQAAGSFAANLRAEVIR
jgi:SRSO17 transposase